MTRYHGPTTLAKLARLAHRRLWKNQWFFMPWFGPTGSGKSGGAMQFAVLIQEKCGEKGCGCARANLPAFDPRRQVVASGSEYSAARRILPKGSVILLDEAIKAGANRRRAMSDGNLALMEDVNTGRKLGHAVLACQPFADDFDQRILKHAHWTARLSTPGTGVAYEVRRIGFRHVQPWEEPRFKFRQEECEVVRPDLWNPYITRAHDDARGEESDALAREDRIRDHELSVRRLFRELIA